MRRLAAAVLGVVLAVGGCTGLNNRPLVVTDAIRQACAAYTASDTVIIEEMADVQHGKEIGYSRAVGTSLALLGCDTEACRVCVLAIVDEIY